MKKISTKPYIIEPCFKYYDWGSYSSIQEITGRRELEEKTVAEMWMGDHPSGANKVKIDTSLTPFHDILDSMPAEILGDKSNLKFNGELPFLFKLLASEKPLSIQAHPDKKQAEVGYERENILNIPLDDFTRGYKDRNHKPEIILALTEFTIMKGFQKYKNIKDNFSTYCPESSSFLFNGIPACTDKKMIKSFLGNMMSAGRREVKKMINESISNSKGNNTLISGLITKFSHFYPEDRGILSPLYLNSAVLQKGDAVYVSAGELHAYVEGTGMELMANSDNVFRGGLTNKHVDRDELFDILKYSPSVIEKVPKLSAKNETLYQTVSEEFLLSEIIVAKDKTYASSEERSIEIIFCLQGKVQITNRKNDNLLNVKTGECFFVPSSFEKYYIEGEGTFYKAAIPL
jgi:mannose-6-phosphate isomerase